MTVENRLVALNYTMEVFEDGSINENEPESVGGISKWGVSLFAYVDYCKQLKLSVPTKDDIRNLTEDQARDVYITRYINPIRFDELPSGPDFALLGFEINVGPTGGVHLLAVAMGVWPVPDRMSDDMIAKANAMDARLLIGLISGAWLGMKYGSTGWKNYGHGWSNREIGSIAKSLTLVK